MKEIIRVQAVKDWFFPSIVEYTIGIACSCVPACFIALRRSFPLLNKLQISLLSRWRSLTTRLVFSTKSRARRLFGSGVAEMSSRNDRNTKIDSAGQEVIVLGNLPEVPQHTYQMLTARAFIWGSKSQGSISVDEERSGTSFSFVWLQDSMIR